MSAGPLYPAPLAGTPNLVTLKFRFQAGAAAGAEPDFIYPSGSGVTDVTRDASAGLYSITMATVYPGFVGGHGHILPADTATLDKVVLIDVADYNTTTGVLIITVAEVDTASATAGSVNPVDMVENDWCYCELTFVQASSDAVVGPIA